MGESPPGDYPASPQGCRVMIKLAQSLPWFGAQLSAPVATAAFRQRVAVVVLWDRCGENHQDTLQRCPFASAAVLRAGETIAAPSTAKHLHRWRLFANMLTLSCSALLPLSPRAAWLCLKPSNSFIPALPSLCPTSSREEPPSMEGSASFWDSFVWEVSVCFINFCYVNYGQE